MIRRNTCVASGAVVVAIGVLGWTYVANTGRAAALLARDKITKIEPQELLEKRVAIELADADKVAKEASQKAAQNEERVTKREQELDDERLVLAKASEKLAKGGKLGPGGVEEIHIGRHVFSRAQVEADVRARLAHCGTLENEIAALKQIAADGRRLADELAIRNREQRAKFEHLVARRENEEIQAELDKLSAENKAALIGQSGLGRDLTELGRRVEAVEISGTTARSEILTSDYLETSPRDLQAEIRKQLAKRNNSEVPPEAELSR